VSTSVVDATEMAKIIQNIEDCFATLDVAGLSTSVSGLSTSVSSISTKLDNVSTSVSGLGTSVSSISTKLDNVSTSVSGLSTSVSNMATKLNHVSTSVSSMSTKLNNVSTSVSVITSLPIIQEAFNQKDSLTTLMGVTQGGGNASNGTLLTQGGGFDNTFRTSTTYVAGRIGQPYEERPTVDAIAAGVGSYAGADGATSYGAWSNAQDANTTAIGFRATATNAGSVAIGFQARAIADPATAVGSNSLASGNDSVALGASAQATANRSVALGAYSVADQANTVSVGSVGNERRITNVANGVNLTDAVNVSQLNDVASRIRGAYTGAVMSMAMNGIVMPSLQAGESGLGLGVGMYKGYTALAFGFKSMSSDGNTAWGVTMSTSGSSWSSNFGVGFKWK
jgi:trimeric autotransporter adhesin